MRRRLRSVARRLGAKAAVLACELQDQPNLAPRPIKALAAWRFAPSLQCQIELLARLARLLRREGGPALAYLDLSVSHLADGEREHVLSTPDDDPLLLGADPPVLPRIVPHRYGAWVHVSDELHDDRDQLRRIEVAGYPSLATVLAFASRRGCNWINFDRDAEDIPELPSYDERPQPIDVTVRPRRRWFAVSFAAGRPPAYDGSR